MEVPVPVTCKTVILSSFPGKENGGGKLKSFGVVIVFFNLHS